jgi:hypothetical protein
VFACNPTKLGSKIISAGWSDWIKEYDFIERKFEKVINEYLSQEEINHLEIDERSIIVDEGVKQFDYRTIIDENIKKHKLGNSKDPWIKKFYNNQIW